MFIIFIFQGSWHDISFNLLDTISVGHQSTYTRKSCRRAGCHFRWGSYTTTNHERIKWHEIFGMHNQRIVTPLSKCTFPRSSFARRCSNRRISHSSRHNGKSTHTYSCWWPCFSLNVFIYRPWFRHMYFIEMPQYFRSQKFSIQTIFCRKIASDDIRTPTFHSQQDQEIVNYHEI